MLEMATKDQMTVDGIIKIMIQLIIIVALTGNLEAIVNSLLSFGETLVNKIYVALSLESSPMTGSEIVVRIAASDETTSFNDLMLSLFFPWVVHQIAVIAISVASFSRAIDIGWRIVYAPIALADSFEGGTNSKGIKYLKTLFSSILSGAVMLTIIEIANAVSVGIIGISASEHPIIAGLASSAALLAGAGASIGAIQKTKEIFN